MSKKHFIALADAIREHNEYFSPEAIEALADFCASQNSQFNRQRWLDYIAGECGPNGGKPKDLSRMLGILSPLMRRQTK